MQLACLPVTVVKDENWERKNTFFSPVFILLLGFIWKRQGEAALPSSYAFPPFNTLQEMAAIILIRKTASPSLPYKQ